MAKVLRGWIESASRCAGIEPPSANQVRRRLGVWFRGRLRDQFGPLRPPVADFGEQLRRLAALAATLAPHLPGETSRIVVELGAQREADEDGDRVAVGAVVGDDAAPSA
jgi:hypothetical protein